MIKFCRHDQETQDHRRIIECGLIVDSAFNSQNLKFCLVIMYMVKKTMVFEMAGDTLVDKIKRKFRILISKTPVFNVHFAQHFVRNSVKFLL